MDRSSRLILRKLILDFLCVFVVGISVLMFFLFGKPYKRGFFCDDESLYHPYHESTVTSTMLYVIGLFLPICTMIIWEYFHWRHFSGNAHVLFGYTIPPWVWNAYQKVGVFGFGAACTVLTTDIAKYTIGRLRPHFMKLCIPNINCSLPENQHKYIEDFHCTATGISPKLLKEVRLSFPSGHSSFSAYTMIYLAMYLHLRMNWEGSKLLKHVLQLICLLMAWFTAMSRISNYKHHWSDVLAGSILGIISALVMTYCVADLFNEKREKHSLEKHRTTDYEAETGVTSTQDESSPLQVKMQTYGGVTKNTEDLTHRCESN